MDVKLDIKYRLELNREEWIVVSKALRWFAAAETAIPVISTDIERDVADKLQEQMLTQKHNTLSQMAGEAGKAVANVKAKGTKP